MSHGVHNGTTSSITDVDLTTEGSVSITGLVLEPLAADFLIDFLGRLG
jgi:hypothetical protein